MGSEDSEDNSDEESGSGSSAHESETAAGAEAGTSRTAQSVKIGVAAAAVMDEEPGVLPLFKVLQMAQVRTGFEMATKPAGGFFALLNAKLLTFKCKITHF